MWTAEDVLAIEVPAAEVPFAVPLEAISGRVGPEYVKLLADRMSGTFERDPRDIGLMDDFAVLRGRQFDPGKVHPLIKEFYQHTTRFKLSVRPKWHWYFRPSFWLFRKLFAGWVGQFNLPFDVREARQGIDSHIDTIDLDHDRIVDLRGWVRTFTGTDLVVYVGIYAAVRLDDLGYVTVGFPLPDANLTATLVPENAGEHDFLLKSHNRDARFAGDYVVFVDERSDALSVFRIRGFREEIEVYVRDGRLFTDHRFFFLRTKFLTLFYTIERKAVPSTERGVARELLMKAPTLRKEDGGE